MRHGFRFGHAELVLLYSTHARLSECLDMEDWQGYA
jgi:hypothetical protein